MSNFFSYDKEKSYRDKLYNLGLRYDEVREKLARYECGELPPKHISELLVSMTYHIKASKALYAAQLKSPSITEQQRKNLKAICVQRGIAPILSNGYSNGKAR